MRPTLAGCAALFAVSSLATAADDVAGNAPSLRLTWVNLSGIADTSVSAALKHTAHVLASARVPVTARRSTAGTAVEDADVTVVLQPEARGREAGGAVAGSMRRGCARTVWIYPRTVATLMGLDPAAQYLWAPRRELEFRRVLGVVIVHELLHRIAGASHDAGGLMSPHFLAGRVAAESRIPQELVAPLRAGVARLAVGQEPFEPPRELEASVADPRAEPGSR